MSRLADIVEKVLDSVLVAANDDEGLGNLALGGHLQGAEVAELVPGRRQFSRVRHPAVDGRDEAETQLLDLINGHDAIAAKAALAIYLEGEHEPQVGYLLSQDHEAVALGAVAVPAAVKLLPVDAEGGHGLDEVAHGGGVGPRDGGRHRVPAVALALQRNGHGVAFVEGRQGVRQAELLPRWARGPAMGILSLLPLAGLGLHALDGVQQDEPRGSLVVDRLDPLPGLRGIGVLGQHEGRLDARLAPGRGQGGLISPLAGARLVAAGGGAVEEVDGLVADGPVGVGRGRDEDDGRVELYDEAQLLPGKAARLGLGPVAHDLLAALRVARRRGVALLEHLHARGQQGNHGDEEGHAGDDQLRIAARHGARRPDDDAVAAMDQSPRCARSQLHGMPPRGVTRATFDGALDGSSGDTLGRGRSF